MPGTVRSRGVNCQQQARSRVISAGNYEKSLRISACGRLAEALKQRGFDFDVQCRCSQDSGASKSEFKLQSFGTRTNTLYSFSLSRPLSSSSDISLGPSGSSTHGQRLARCSISFLQQAQLAIASSPFTYSRPLLLLFLSVAALLDN